MISRCLSLALFVAVFAPGVLCAQTVPQSLEARGVIEKAINHDKMYEDIEIMRRILDRKLETLYPQYRVTRHKDDDKVGDLLITQLNTARPGIARQFWADPKSNTQYWVDLGFPNKLTVLGQEVSSSLEGVYLKGHGVIYTATLSSLQPPANVEADSSEKLHFEIEVYRPESEWESIRKQVRNEKEKPKKPEAKKPPSLSDFLLKVLAANGHHFSQLRENERLTIVLTVHESNSSSPTPKSGTGSTKTESNPTIVDLDANGRRDTGNLGMLGSLHLQQKKYAEALEVFQKLLGLAISPKVAAQVHRRLAECYLGLGEDEKARAELDKAIALMKEEKKANDKPAAKPAAALPVKLIISASKKLLDQVKAGKISFEEFRRQASVETHRFDDRR